MRRRCRGARVLSPLAEDPYQEALAIVVALEEQCAIAERHLNTLDWGALETAWFEERRLTHAIDNALHALPLPIDAQWRVHFETRLKAIHASRELQLRRIEKYCAGISERMTIISRFRAAARSLGKQEMPPVGLARLDATQ